MGTREGSIVAALATIAVVLGGCGGSGGGGQTTPSPGPSPPPGPTPTPGPTPPPTPKPSTGFKCESDTIYDGLVRMEDKGIVLDDISFLNCPDEILGVWPNTNQNVKVIRTNAPWRAFWPGGYSDPNPEREKRLAHLVKLVKDNDMKVLLGQDATCNETDDDIQWNLNKELIRKLGPDHIMGIAIGNEMDILWQHHDWWRKGFPNCMIDLWQKEHYWKAFQRRVADMDKILGSSSVPVTSVWTAGFSNSGAPGNNPPFMEYPGRALVRSFVTKAHKKYGKRWVWTFNPYPIWTQNLVVDPGTTDKCNLAIAATRGPIAASMVAFARKATMILTGNGDEEIWGGEIGWSSPVSDGMEWIPGQLPLKCKNYTSVETFGGYYEHFLKWDLGLSEVPPPHEADRKLKGLSKGFYFTQRDADNGAAHEYFGLIKKCGDTKCKVQGLTKTSASLSQDAGLTAEQAITV